MTAPLASHLTTPAARAALPAWFDRHGFLADGERWTPDLAGQIAASEGIDVLGAKHWAVIRLVRERYFAIGALPVMRLICRAAGIEPGRGHELFPSCRSLWRIAGLPDPGEEAKAYMN
ncbi:MAG: TusE/DsrC/DsvC family sulfur relay protein [Burkholderiaceae bacterium]